MSSPKLNARVPQRLRPISARPHRPVLAGLLVFAITVAAAACSPKPPPYPYYGPYGSSQGVTNEAQRRSNLLEQYVKDFLDGKVSATIPNSLIPEGRSSDLTTFTIKRPNEINPAKQWAVRAAHTINWASSLGNYNDPHAGYMVNFGVLAPFGSKIIIDGQFPKTRYFSIQASPSFKPENYRSGAYGEGEVAWLDADINPNVGSTNPFRVGANRSATSRNFQVTCDVRIGDPSVLDASAWTAPNFRQAGNNRNCSGLTYRGPWGDPAWADGDKRGQWSTSELWIRIYGPDKSGDGFGNMAPPKITYQLPDGRQYYIEADQTAVQNTQNKRRALFNEGPSDNANAGYGWDKQISILRSIYAGISNGFGINGATEAERQKYVRDLDRGVAGRADDIPGIMSKDPHATGGTHINYLTRTACLGAGKLYVLAGKMPTTPKTRDGEATMTAGEARYWSLTGYSIGYNTSDPTFVYGAEITTVMDDEIVTKNGDYTIMYGRAADRPSNATAANGVTWVEWGPEACQGMTLRWVSAGPEWIFAKSPTQDHLPWAAAWANANYNKALIGTNNRNGFLGAYQPVVTYKTKAEFQAFGNGFNPLTLPPY